MEFVEAALSKLWRQPLADQLELVRIAAEIEADPIADVEGGRKGFSPLGDRSYRDGYYWLTYEQDPDGSWYILDFGYPGFTP